MAARRAACFGIAAATLAASACAQKQGTSPPDDKGTSGSPTATVRIDVYSGRPDPNWTLSVAQTEELMRRFRALEAVELATPPFDGLGYRSTTAEIGAFPDAIEVTASRGFVTLKRSGNQEQRADANRQFERWLVSTGEGRVASALIARIQEEIASSP